jgi:4-hydroxy-tetrahydrodipicolinate synthase
MHGLFAAVATPIRENGDLDLPVLDRLVDFLAGSGVDGLCVGGATGEYPHFETADRRAVIERVRRRLPSNVALVAGVGAPSTARTIDMGRAALDDGCAAVLLPMPMFFRYEQQDLAAFATAASRGIAGPCLLYDLPDFTNGLRPETSVELLERERFIVGIKDSSGREPNLATFAEARGQRPWSLFVGDDRLLARGLAAGWNGGISGIAGVCPELIVGLYRSHRGGKADERERWQSLLDRFIERLSVFPTPWAIRLGLGARGLGTGPLPLPLTAERQQQAAEFVDWLPGWLRDHGIAR